MLLILNPNDRKLPEKRLELTCRLYLEKKLWAEGYFVGIRWICEVNGEGAGQGLWDVMRSLEGTCKDGRTEEVGMEARIWGNIERVSI